jgi:hypothetical protein
MRPLNLGTFPTPEQQPLGQNPEDLATPASLLESLRATVRDRPGTVSATGLGTYIATGATYGNTTWAVMTIALGMLIAETIQNVKIKRDRA